MKKINGMNILIQHPVQFTPFSFPLMVDGLSRSSISSEPIEDKIAKILAQMTADD